MRKYAIFLSIFFATASAVAADEPKTQEQPASAAAPSVVLAPQRWEQAVRFACMQNISAATFERQLNQQVAMAGQQGYELVSASPGKFSGQDCIALAYRRPVRP